MILSDLQKSIEKHSSNNAFYINGAFHTYKELSQLVSNIRQLIKTKTHKNDCNIGLITNDDLETYASIIGLWLEGKAYVPINPDFPETRNRSIIEQAKINVILDSSETPLIENQKTMKTKGLSNSKIDLVPVTTKSKEAIAYILFTSGTTGVPKGVPITFENLSSFFEAFNVLCPDVNNQDKCLQMFELTFDMSVLSYLLPLLNGACVYTLPKSKIKYMAIFELMEEHKLTIAIMVPSIINYLRPYFEEINCPHLKFNLFAGEALYLDVLEEWSNCIPNATIVNAYGPTETTIICTSYNFNRNKENKTHNGIMCIGKDMNDTFSMVVGDDDNEVEIGKTGELCITGKQVTPGYWENPEKNEASFFYKNHNGENLRFYRTGDACFKDKSGDFLYVGRVDFQAKIQGFRVELSEIEFHVKAYLSKWNAVSLAVNNGLNNTEIALVIESNEILIPPLLEYLKTKMPQYMVPTQIKFIEQFPLNTNGKIDRNKLKTLFNN